MKYILFSLAVLLITSSIIISCSKPSDNECIGGKGGDHEVAVFAKHGSTNIINYTSHPDTAFVKYNTLISPGTLSFNFDTFYVSEAGEDHIHCEALKCGNYYIYRTAFDSAANTVYKGSLAITIGKDVQAIDTTVLVN